MIKYTLIEVVSFTNGFITHNDKEVDNLSFSVNECCVLVEGDEVKIDNWLTRTGNIAVSEEVYLDNLPETIWLDV